MHSAPAACARRNAAPPPSCARAAFKPGKVCALNQRCSQRHSRPVTAGGSSRGCAASPGSADRDCCTDWTARDRRRRCAIRPRRGPRPPSAPGRMTQNHAVLIRRQRPHPLPQGVQIRTRLSHSTPQLLCSCHRSGLSSACSRSRYCRTASTAGRPPAPPPPAGASSSTRWPRSRSPRASAIKGCMSPPVLDATMIKGPRADPRRQTATTASAP